MMFETCNHAEYRCAITQPPSWQYSSVRNYQYISCKTDPPERLASHAVATPVDQRYEPSRHHACIHTVLEQNNCQNVQVLALDLSCHHTIMLILCGSVKPQIACPPCHPPLTSSPPPLPQPTLLCYAQLFPMYTMLYYSGPWPTQVWHCSMKETLHNPMGCHAPLSALPSCACIFAPVSWHTAGRKQHDYP